MKRKKESQSPPRMWSKELRGLVLSVVLGVIGAAASAWRTLTIAEARGAVERSHKVAEAVPADICRLLRRHSSKQHRL